MHINKLETLYKTYWLKFRFGVTGVNKVIFTKNATPTYYVFFTYFPTSDFDHYYVLRIFHVYKCTVNENTNKSAYWYTSLKSSIPDFAKPGIVAEMCPFFISAHWLAHVSLDSSIISKREHMGVATTLLPNYENWVVPFTCYGWISSVVWLQSASCSKSYFGWFPLFFMVHSVVWLQRVFHLKSSGWFLFYGSQCCLAQKCSLLKIIILGGSLHLL